MLGRTSERTLVNVHVVRLSNAPDAYWLTGHWVDDDPVHLPRGLVRQVVLEPRVRDHRIAEAPRKRHTSGHHARDPHAADNQHVLPSAYAANNVANGRVAPVRTHHDLAN